MRQLAAVRASLDPLHQQIAQLQETDLFQREEGARERAGLQARVLELEAERARQEEVVRSLERRVVEGQDERAAVSQLAEQVRRL